MGNIFRLISGIGVIFLATLIILAIIALTTGHFDPTYTNPPS